jgi:hypothetical protein
MHLRGIEVEVKYMELVLLNEHPGLLVPAKWKSDTDVNPSQQFAPRSRYYINGEFSRIGQLGQTRILTKPPPGDDRVPRRGLVRAYPGDPDYEKICKQQGLLQFLSNEQISPVSSTNAHTTGTDSHTRQMNGYTPPDSDLSHSMNGGSPAVAAVGDTHMVAAPVLTNGVLDEDGSPAEPALQDSPAV